MLELPGQAALSDFRLAKLTRSLRRADERVEAVETENEDLEAENAELEAENEELEAELDADSDKSS